MSLFNHRGKMEKHAAPKSHAAAGRIMLTQLDNGASAKVMELRGGHLVVGKLEAMGIVPGSTITKNGSSIMNGPIVLKKGSTQIAIGYAMAQRILVEPGKL
jgi:Fe2+ transport system protein FeoA